uniref:Uncharacterized protein n=1 Tax=Vitis vinifera TaxID=29760 RepID=A5BTM4_VITVI|nr:hypothetical protein VITISV_042143 [Vitis vinifera]
MGRSRIGGQPPGESNVHGPGGGITPFSKEPYVTLSRHTAPSRNKDLPFPLTNGSSNQPVPPFYSSVAVACFQVQALAVEASRQKLTSGPGRSQKTLIEDQKCSERSGWSTILRGLLYDLKQADRRSGFYPRGCGLMLV